LMVKSTVSLTAARAIVVPITITAAILNAKSKWVRREFRRFDVCIALTYSG
jgi:hypothetical protein